MGFLLSLQQRIQFLRGLGHVNFPGCTSGVIEEQMLTVQNVNNRFDPLPLAD